MWKKILIGVVIVVVLIIAVAAVIGFFMMRGPDVGQFEVLREPRIGRKPDQKMLVVEATGDPSAVGSKAFSLLFKAYFKGWHMVAPRARWPKPPDTPRSEWVGLYGMPVPDSTEKLPDVSPEPGCKLSLTTWEYGQVAEILHVGPYSGEAPTIKKLEKYVDEKGYKIVGVHEEEYLRGPGMFGKGDPEKYCTILRYRVEEK
jgi:hypothetical protein